MENLELKRLEEVAKKHFRNLANVALLLGKKHQTLYSYRNRSGLGRVMLEDLEKILQINPEYIKFGREPMLLTEKKEATYGEPNVTNIRDFRVSEQDVEYLSQIKVYSLTVHANTSNSLVSFDDLPVSFTPLVLGRKFNPKNVFAVRISGFSMDDAGIYDGDLALFDKSIQPKDGNIVICLLNGVALIKKFGHNKDGAIILESEHNGIEPIVVNHIDDKFQIIGVVIHVIKNLY